MRCIPNMIVAAPLDEIELRNMMYTAQLGGYGPFSIRYPRGNGSNADWRKPFEKMEIGKGRQLSEGEKLAILSIGAIGVEAINAVKELKKQDVRVSHYDMRFVKPLDEDLLTTIFDKYDTILTVEDGALKGGFGSAVLEYANTQNYKGKIVQLGIPDSFIEHGTQQELYAECGYNQENIVHTIQKLLSQS